MTDEKKLELENTLTKEVLTDLYVSKGWSANKIAKTFGPVSACFVIKRLKFFKINTRSISEANNMPDFRKQVETTCLKKFGTINPLSKGSPAFEKRNETVLTKYGVKNVRQAKEVKDKIHSIKVKNGTLGKNNPIAISEAYKNRLDDKEWSTWFSSVMSNNWKKTKDNMSDLEKKNYEEKRLKGWHIWWENLKPNERETFFKKSKFCSKLETTFLDLIEQHSGLSVIRQIWIPGIQGSFDGYIKEYNLLIEVNGTYWHADPRKYNAKDILRFPKGKEIEAELLWKKDFKKTNEAISQGYSIITCWETDINSILEIEVGRIMEILYNAGYNKVDKENTTS